MKLFLFCIGMMYGFSAQAMSCQKLAANQLENYVIVTEPFTFDSYKGLTSFTVKTAKSVQEYVVSREELKAAVEITGVNTGRQDKDYTLNMPYLIKKYVEKGNEIVASGTTGGAFKGDVALTLESRELARIIKATKKNVIVTHPGNPEFRSSVASYIVERNASKAKEVELSLSVLRSALAVLNPAQVRTHPASFAVFERALEQFIKDGNRLRIAESGALSSSQVLRIFRETGTYQGAYALLSPKPYSAAASVRDDALYIFNPNSSVPFYDIRVQSMDVLNTIREMKEKGSMPRRNMTAVRSFNSMQFFELMLNQYISKYGEIKIEDYKPEVSYNKATFKFISSIILGKELPEKGNVKHEI